MEIGVSTATFFGKAYTEDALKIISGLKTGVAEVFLATFSEFEPEFADRLLQNKRAGLRVHSVHSCNTIYEPQLFNRSPRAQGDAFVYFKKVIDIAAAIGANANTFHGATRNKYLSAHNYDFKAVGYVMEELINYSSAKGVDVTFENVYWAMFAEPEFFRKLKEYSPRLRSCLDIKQAVRSGYSVYEYIKAMGDTIKTVHVLDLTVDGETCLPGRGSFDFYGLFSALYDVNPDVPVMLEQYPEDFAAASEIDDAIDYLNGILARVK
ncbi:MAG: sugar phosphate isomerase/epimerase [Clostridiaceae bacterium]|nr:sugar phosphate isomerase/epimerase [Clostridiaceae bacterium]